MRRRLAIAILIATCACWLMAQAYTSLQAGQDLLALKVRPGDLDGALKLLSDSQAVQQAMLLGMEEVILQDAHGRRQETLTALLIDGEGAVRLPGILLPIQAHQQAAFLNQISTGQLLNSYEIGGAQVLLEGKLLPLVGSFKQPGFWPYLGFMNHQAYAVISGRRGADSLLLIRMQPFYDSNMTVELIKNLMNQNNIEILGAENLGLKAGLVRRSIVLFLIPSVLVVLNGFWMRFLYPAMKVLLSRLRQGLETRSMHALIKSHTGFLFMLLAGFLAIAAGLSALAALLRAHWIMDVSLLPSEFSVSAIIASITNAFRNTLLPNDDPSLFMLQLRAAHVIVRISGLALLLAAFSIRRAVKNKC